ncbi:hypothetical protein L218DRAFT_944426 [Marasmius fiardii PR-910]|nr:hypothetical protein L218DRAFT_944426 [Marasmius fiardii PR-910]
MPRPYSCGNNSGSLDDPIIIDSDDERPSNLSTLNLPPRWHRTQHSCDNIEIPQVEQRELAIDIKFTLFNKEATLITSATALLKGLPVGVTSNELSTFLATHGLSQLTQSVTLYTTACVAVIQFYRFESIEFARQVLKRVNSPFPQRYTNTPLFLEQLEKLNVYTEAVNRDSTSCGAADRVQVLPPSRPYGKVDDIYKNLDMENLSDSDGLSLESTDIPLPAPGCYPNSDDTVTQPRLLVCSDSSSGSDSSVSDVGMADDRSSISHRKGPLRSGPKSFPKDNHTRGPFADSAANAVTTGRQSIRSSVVEFFTSSPESAAWPSKARAYPYICWPSDGHGLNAG